MVKVLSRNAVQRMTGRRSSSAVNIGSGSGDASGVSRAWVEENYISKAFFNTLFTIHGTETEGGVTTDVIITPNDTQTTLNNIQAMVGLWTNSYLSALGLNPGGGGGGVTLNNVLDGINNTTFPSATPSSAGQAIVWNGTKWTFGTAGGGGGSVTSVGLSVPTGFTVNNSPITSAGTIQLGFETGYSLPTTAKQTNWDTAYSWGNHANAGYATQSWVTQQGYITSSALNGYATQSWVQQQGYITSSALTGYLPLSGGTMTGDLHLGSSAGASPFIYFGDQSFVYIGEDADDHLTIKGAKGVNFIVGSNYNVTINSANIATQSWVQQQGYLTSHQSVDGTFWGQSWSNHGSVSGDMTGVGNITTSGNIKMGGQYYLMGVSGTNGAMIESTLSTVTIGLHSGNGIEWDTRTGSGYMLQIKYDVDNVVSKKYVQIWDAIRLGDAMLIWDATNNAIKVIKADGSAANFYATGGISALGYSS